VNSPSEHRTSQYAVFSQSAACIEFSCLRINECDRDVSSSARPDPGIFWTRYARWFRSTHQRSRDGTRRAARGWARGWRRHGQRSVRRRAPTAARPAVVRKRGPVAARAKTSTRTRWVGGEPPPPSQFPRPWCPSGDAERHCAARCCCCCPRSLLLRAAAPLSSCARWGFRTDPRLLQEVGSHHTFRTQSSPSSSSSPTKDRIQKQRIFQHHRITVVTDATLGFEHQRSAHPEG
jgi:hypothetical protein